MKKTTIKKYQKKLYLDLPKGFRRILAGKPVKHGDYLLEDEKVFSGIKIKVCFILIPESDLTPGTVQKHEFVIRKISK